MANKSVPVSQAVRFGWETFKGNAWFLVGIFVVVSVVTSVLERVANSEPFEGTPAGFLIEIVDAAVQMLLEVGLIGIILKFVDGQRPEFGDLFNRVDLLLKYTGAAILYLLMIVFGLLLLVFPGVYLAIRYQFFGYFIVDQGVGPIEALKMSSDLTQDIRMELFAFAMLLLLINLAGLIAFIVGIYVSLPVSALATGFVFRYLRVPPPGRETEVITRAA